MIEPLRALIVEDSQDDALLIAAELRRTNLKVHYAIVDTPVKMQAALDQEPWDLVISDYSMPKFNGLAALKLLQERGLEIPFILVSGTVGEEVAVAAMKAGAQDYIMKDDMTRLAPAVQRELREAEVRRARRRAEAALQAQQQRFGAILDSVSDVIFVQDPANGAVLDVNERVEDVYGYSRDEVRRGKLDPMSSTEPPYTRAEAQDWIRKTMTQGPQLFEWRVRHKDGHEFWVEIHTRRAELGGRSCLVVVVRDVSERKRAEQALTSEQRLLQTLMGSVPDAIYFKDAAGRFTRINKALADRFGLSDPAEAVGKSDFDFSSADHARQAQADDERVLRTGQPVVNALVRETRPGHPDTWVLSSKLPLRDPRGDIVGTFGVSRDVTALKRSEEQLRTLSRAVEQSPASVIITDTHGAIEYVNPKFEQLTGFSLDEVRGQNPRILKTDETPPATFQDLWATLAAGRDWRGEFCNRKKNGELFWESAVISPIKDDHGKTTHYLGIKEDITARKKADGERRAMEAQLREAQKLEAIGQLAAGIAHEINTPTQYLGDNTRFLQDAFADLNRLLEAYGQFRQAVPSGAVPPAVADALDRAAATADLPYLLQEIPKAITQSLEGVERVSSIVRAMKEFSHPGSEEKTPVDLNRAIESTLTVSRNEWKYVADLVTDLDPDLPLVPCFPGEFNQVILNLVVNAAHAISDAAKVAGGAKGTITVRTRRAGDAVEIRVQDTGTGIPEAIRHRIFEPFFTTKPVGKGTGQGLAIARSVIVDKHGGTLRFETESGRGTTFIVQMPVSPPPPAQKTG